jgi:hypothetical protein
MFSSLAMDDSKRTLRCLRLKTIKYCDRVSSCFFFPYLAFFLNKIKKNYNMNFPLALHLKIYPFGRLCCL